MLKLMHRRLDQELDLKRFIKRQRATTMAVLGLLSGRKSRLVDKLSELVIGSEIGSGNEHFDSGEDLDQEKIKDIDKRLIERGEKIDKRFMRIYQMNKPGESRIENDRKWLDELDEVVDPLQYQPFSELRRKVNLGQEAYEQQLEKSSKELTSLMDQKTLAAVNDQKAHETKKAEEPSGS